MNWEEIIKNDADSIQGESFTDNLEMIWDILNEIPIQRSHITYAMKLIKKWIAERQSE